MTIVPLRALPADESERRVVLREYFHEWAAEAIPSAGGWRLDVRAPERADWYVDPHLARGLDWWGGAAIGDIPYAHRCDPAFTIALNDHWTLLSWSRRLAQVAPAPTKVVVLHVDDHDDLMSPRVLRRGSTLIDGMTGIPIEISQPASIDAALRSGAIGIGSFIAPLIHSVPTVAIRHLCATRYSYERRGPHRLVRSLDHDGVLARTDPRIAVRVEPGLPDPDEPTHAGSYDVTNDPEEWLFRLPDGVTLLHIDMDYFNNRYNGDSDWASQTVRHDPPLTDVLTQIEAVVTAIGPVWAERSLVDVSVALSPGFFPADLWKAAMDHLGARLLSIVGRRQ
jgi:hypothetical protein